MDPRTTDLGEIINLRHLCKFLTETNDLQLSCEFKGNSINKHQSRKEKRTFYINKPGSLQGEVFTKEQKQDNSHSKKKKSTIIKNLKSKPQQEDSLSALTEEEEPRRWTLWQDPWLYQVEGWHQE